MKRNILLVLFLLVVIFAKSQTYYPFQTDTAQWNVDSYDGSNMQPVHRTYSYFINGDTIIDTLLYSKIYEDMAVYDTIIDTISAYYLGGLREDNNKHIYFKPSEIYIMFSLKCGLINTDLDEFLLYRFDLSIGDTFNLNQHTIGAGDYSVFDIDSVLIGQHYRKRFMIRNFNNMFGDDHWIEGIGSLQSLFGPTCFPFEAWDQLLCYKDPNTDFVSYMSFEDDCTGFVVGAYENKQPNIHIYPNPCRTKLNIEIASGRRISEINVYNLLGQNIIHEKIETDNLDVSSITTGVYIIELQLNSIIIREKLIIK